MYAIIEESGSQRKVVTGDVISVDLLNSGQATIGQAITFDKVLVVGEVGGSAKVGAPYVAGASVKGEVVTPDVKGEKLVIQKFQAKNDRRPAARSLAWRHATLDLASHASPPSPVT